MIALAKRFLNFQVTLEIVWTILCAVQPQNCTQMVHDKKAVAVFIMCPVIDNFVMKRHPDVKQVYVFSDGPSFQFKNKYMAIFLQTRRKTVHVQWNFFATSHGKGVVHGIGGTESSTLCGMQ